MFVTPFQAARLSTQTGVMIAEAQMVIAMRLWGMAGLWNVTPGETLRMVQEKTEAVMQSAALASTAMLRGRDGGAVALAALQPVRRRTRANLRRLQARGPKL
ncbi:antifreeze protein [Gemmobacter serpentinus]|uniref:antifreeze protein n=1 Tax=Gemmobacter serpentinus TaxID=2652247 RepID=UPI00124CEC98|nr:antifreeze protein [Gemmobacter serpentinus]